MVTELDAWGTHWFAPFPPGPVEKEDAVRVSPPEGTRGVTVNKSMLREPMMVIVLGAMLKLEAWMVEAKERGRLIKWSIGLAMLGLYWTKSPVEVESKQIETSIVKRGVR